MSTRSGKRVHRPSNEDVVETETEVNLKSERKTRSKRVVENGVTQEVALKPKKRQNYVTYPSEEEVTVTNTVENEMQFKPVRALQRYTLREQNAASEETDLSTHVKKQGRQTRRTKKLSETVTEEQSKVSQHEEVIEIVTIISGKLYSKKNKKKSKKAKEQVEAMDKENDLKEIKKKKNKKKKNSQSNYSVGKIDENNEEKKQNYSMSTDSFHSAAGSPILDVDIDRDMTSSPNTSTKNDETSSRNDTADCTKNKRKSSLKNKSYDLLSSGKLAMDVDITINTTFDKVVNDKATSRRNSSLKNSTFEKDKPQDTIEKLNTTFEKDPTNKTSNKRKRRSYIIKSTVDNAHIGFSAVTSDVDVPKTSNGILNTTFEKDDIIDEADHKKLRKSYIKEQTNDLFISTDSSQSSNTVSEKNKKSLSPRKSLLMSENTALDGTFDISPKPEPTKQKSFDTIFDKETKLDSTFDKIYLLKPNSSSKSSLASSDATESTINVTLDKSDEVSRITITDDDSKTENILNTTPLLIESSLEQSKILENSLKENEAPVPPPPTTPLKRESTFTKEEPEFAMTPTQTPEKRQTLPAAGCTPYHSNGQGSKKKSVLNLTHSIEKLGRRSSLAEVMPRATRVMFCSPINNPTIVMQQKSKVIKSNLKGSNKSFVFEESAVLVSPNEQLEPTLARAGRKRSFTHTEGQRAKRSRLAEARSSERLSRPRTTSATAKLSTAVTPQKPATPLKPKSDAKTTKLPNFAALHARRFDRMESLDECQLRRARRARQLLAPAGSLTVLERGSPRVTLEPSKSKDSPQKPSTPAKPVSKLLDTLQRGYTRFGFKMDCGVNPFSIPSKTAELKPKEIIPKGLSVVKSRPTQPSVAGATSLRKAAAKQTIMREKSFTMTDKRQECRTVIKGVRTNRRFELQMKSRNLNG